MEDYKNLMNQLKPKYGLKKTDHCPAPWEGSLPKTWIFNDFGQVAVKYFSDSNGNRQLDAVAEIHFFPGTQAIAFYQLTKKQLGRSLHSTHG